RLPERANGTRDGVHRSVEVEGASAGPCGGRAAFERRSREPAGGAASQLARAEGGTRRGRRSRDPAGLPGSPDHRGRLARVSGILRAARATRSMRRFVLFLVLAIVAAGAASAGLYMRVRQPFRGYEAAEQFVDIPQGAGTREIGERLVAAGVIPDR